MTARGHAGGVSTLAQTVRHISKEIIVANAQSAVFSHQGDTPHKALSPSSSRFDAAEIKGLTVTSDERSRIIAGLAFFHGMAQSTATDPWCQWRAAEAQIDAVLNAHAPDSVL